MGGCHSEGMKKRVSASSGGWCGMKLKRQMWTRSFRMECMWKEVSALPQELPVSVLCSCAPFSRMYQYPHCAHCFLLLKLHSLLFYVGQE